jgi:hypothetical protein
MKGIYDSRTNKLILKLVSDEDTALFAEKLKDHPDLIIVNLVVCKKCGGTGLVKEEKVPQCNGEEY